MTRGVLKVSRLDENNPFMLVMDFPADEIKQVQHPPQQLVDGLGLSEKKEILIDCYLGLTKYLVVLKSEEEVQNLNVNYDKLALL